MELRETDPLPREVDLVRLRVQEWRQGKMGPCCMPSEIGAAAIGLAKGFGVCRIARAVGLDAVWLRTKVAQSKARPLSPEPRFLEFPAGIVMAAGLAEARPSETGDRLEAGSSLDVAGFVAAFLGRVC